MYNNTKHIIKFHIPYLHVIAIAVATKTIIDTWKSHGLKHEDYTAAYHDLHGTISNPTTLKPIRRPYKWRYGVMDGAPEGTHSSYPARLPKPQRETDTRSSRDRERVECAAREPAGRNGKRGGNDRRRSGGRGCREGDLIWPRCLDDDDSDDDYAHPGQGGCNDHHSRERFKGDVVRRERTRSPRRRDSEFRGRRRGLGDDGSPERTTLPARHARTSLGSFYASLPNTEALKAFFCAKATELKINRNDPDRNDLADCLDIDGIDDNTTQAPKESMVSADEYNSQVNCFSAEDFIATTSMLADRLDIYNAFSGDATWPVDMEVDGCDEEEVPASRVFYRLKTALKKPTSISEVEEALVAMQLAAELGMATGDDDSMVPDNSGCGPQVASQHADGPNGSAHLLGLTTPTPALTMMGCATPTNEPSRSLAHSQELQPPLGCDLQKQVGQLQANDGHNDNDEGLDGVDALFRTPEAAVTNLPPARRARPRRTFDMTALRRSARLAKKPSMPAAERAQRNLWRKLGLEEDELAPMEEVLRQFISMFTRPLPENIIAAMTTAFDLDDEGADALHEALLRHAGEALADLQQEGGPSAI
ncbi:unnamed protein product [Urochloa humidicola]